MCTPIFLSTSRPQHAGQEQFAAHLKIALETRGLGPRTVGVPQPCVGSPLPAMRRLMAGVSGLAVIAFRRTWMTERGIWLTSVFCQIETAMAYQLGLPILIARERGVAAEGMLEDPPGCWHLPEFDADRPFDHLMQSRDWTDALADWSAQVHLRSLQMIDSAGEAPYHPGGRRCR